MKLIFLIALISSAVGFKIYTRKPAKSIIFSSSSWQEDLDKFLDIDTTWDSRRELVEGSFAKIPDIGKDVAKAVGERDLKFLAPTNLKYGKAIWGLQSITRQLVGDLVPYLVLKGVPKVVTSTPKVIQDVAKTAPGKSQEFASVARDFAQEAIVDISKELRNVFDGTPEGLYSPAYEVLKKTDDYEIRKYASYSVSSAKIYGDDEEVPATTDFDPLAFAGSFKELIAYTLGNNAASAKVAFTTPAILKPSAMEFVLPEGLTAATAPNPNSTSITLRDVPSEIVAVREFPGLVTDGEVSRQRAKLESSLRADGFGFDNSTFTVLQYSSPLTLLFLRRNEVVLNLDVLKTWEKLR